MSAMGKCICGAVVENPYPISYRSFCSGTCAARAAAAVAYAEQAQAFIVGYIVAQGSPDRAVKVLRELQKGLEDVRKGPESR